MEVEVGFICANLPQCRPLFLKVFGKKTQSQTNPSAGDSAAFRSRHRSHHMTKDKDGFERILDKGNLDGALSQKDDSLEDLSGNNVPLRSIVVETQLSQTESRTPQDDKEYQQRTKSVAITTNATGPNRL